MRNKNTVINCKAKILGSNKNIDDYGWGLDRCGRKTKKFYKKMASKLIRKKMKKESKTYLNEM